MALYEDYISDDPSLPHCNNGVFESPKHPVFGLQTAKCGCYDSETKTTGELVRIKDQTPIRRGVFIYKVQCISRPLRRLTEHRLLDELLRRRMEALEEMEGEQGGFQDGFDESETEDEQGSFQVGFNEVGCKKKMPPALPLCL